MRLNGIEIDGFRAIVNWLSYQVLEPLFPAPVRLAAAAAIEHHNATIAKWFLDRGLMRGAVGAELRRLFVWHFAEEIEHKETVFALLQETSPGWPLRALGLLFSVTTFLAYLMIGAGALAARASSTSNGFWGSMRCHLFRADGLIRTLARGSCAYLRGGFHPRDDDSGALLSAAIAELTRLGIEAPADTSCPRELPPAFQRRLTPFRKRLDALESQYSFFFTRIDGYEGSWVQCGKRKMLNFCTYSYLGLLHHPQIQRAAQQAVDQFGTGTHGVRLLGGNLAVHEVLETTIARIFHREAAITFSSGFMANQTVIATLVSAGDHVFSDARNHASIIDGCRLSGAQRHTFHHNDIADLRHQLGAVGADEMKLIVVDAVYSMDGDIAPLLELIALRDACPNTLLMVDEAHSLGVLGAGGLGIEEHFDCRGAVDVLMGTLSKTIPAQGGYVAGSRELIEYLRHGAGGFVFSAALAPPSSAAALAAFDVLVAEGAERRRRLMANVNEFIASLRSAGFDVGDSVSAIVPILLGSETLAFEMAKYCHRHNVFVMPVAYPAVAAGTERLRLNVTADHRPGDLEYALQTLVKARRAVRSET